MNYELKHFNTTLVRFSATEDTAAPDINILWVNEECRDLLPLGMELSGSGIAKWLKQRTIPKNRAYVNSFLSKCGLHINRPMNIIRVSKGLSLNDCYWVVEEGFNGTFEKYNLYDNRFSQLLAMIAFTGYGSSVRTSLVSCPEFTTNGMLPKCWRRVNGTIRLYKGGTSGASNTGCEPYSEYYAAQIAEAMGINSVSYNLSKWKGELCSVCDLFTSKDYSYLPIGRMVTAGGMEAVREYYQSLGKEYIDALNAMLVFDAVIFNTDRHFGNFGLTRCLIMPGVMIWKTLRRLRLMLERLCHALMMILPARLKKPLRRNCARGCAICLILNLKSIHATICQINV